MRAQGSPMDRELALRSSSARGVEPVTQRGDSEPWEGTGTFPEGFHTEVRAGGQGDVMDVELRAWHAWATEVQQLGARVTMGPGIAQEVRLSQGQG
jgi:hypothetical protein